MRPSRCYLEPRIARSLSRRRQPRVVLFGGSFHPAHAGHLRAAIKTRSQLRPDAVIWLISPHNPLKPRGAAFTKPTHRRLYAERLTRSHNFAVSCLEERIKTHYTIDILAAWQAIFPHIQLFFLIGADLIVQLSLWHQSLALLNSCRLAVVVRPPYSAGQAIRLHYDMLNQLMGKQTLASRFRPVIIRCIGCAARASLIRRMP